MLSARANFLNPLLLLYLCCSNRDLDPAADPADRDLDPVADPADSSTVDESDDSSDPRFGQRQRIGVSPAAQHVALH